MHKGEMRKKISAAIFDPGATEGYKADRTLTEWQTDAVLRALSALVEEKRVVEVKALEWEDAALWNSYGLIIRIAQTRFGAYKILKGSQGRFEVYFGGDVPFSGAMDALEEALLWAQSDYESRIRNALVDVPAVESEPVALIEREVLAELQKHWNATGTVCSPLFEQNRYKIFDKVPLYASPVRSAIAPAPAEETWQPIETAPKDGKHCILAVQEGAFIYSVQGAFDGKQWNAVHREGVEPLCWMPNARLPSVFLPASFRLSPSLVHAEDGVTTPRPEGRGF